MQRKIKSRRELMTAVVIYFSRAGENYLNGTKQRITKRNTAILAEKSVTRWRSRVMNYCQRLLIQKAMTRRFNKRKKKNKLLHGLIMRSCQLI